MKQIRIKFNLGLLSLFALLAFSACMKMHMDPDVTARDIAEKIFSNPLPVPPVLDGKSAAFDAKSSTSMLSSGITVNSLGYAGAPILGATIRIEQGENFNLDFKNNLIEATNIHWHGLEVPAAQDGYPTDVIAPGGSFQYSFQVKNRPGTYWYHPHPDMATASQAYRGLAGFFIVGSAEESALGLPSGEFDVPLVVQDKRLDGGLTYAPSDNDRSIGLFGETVLVNGKPGAMFEVATRTYRFRLLNGSNARIYNFTLSSGATMELIGTDGGLLDAPVAINSVLLSPGERAEVLVNFGGLTVGDEVFLKSNAFAGSATQGKQDFKIMKFIVTRQEDDPFVQVSTLMPVEKIVESEAIAIRTFNIGHMMAHSGTTMSGMIHPLDGKFFDPNRRDEVVNANSVEIWEFDNTNGTETHPMHLHAGQFQVLSRTGGRGQLEAWEKGWKDTVLAFPGEKVRIIVRFPGNLGKYVFHCHNLEHEDGGMMLNYEIK
ncbi:MAG: multicopper oxidase family protein [Saprospiraceae bacterium]|nr:multicopper oxidase family protein [Saprospiraceae bacterium]